MVQFGCLAHFDHKYIDDVVFARENKISFLQIWYDRNGISLNKDKDKLDVISKANYPSIIHAVLDINEFESHVPELIKITKILNQKELIIHPVCKSEIIGKNTIYKLIDKIEIANALLVERGIKLHVENNSKLDLLLNTAEDIKLLFSKQMDVELLLDIAHMDSYEHLKEIVNIKKPKILHLADRHLEVVHEHLPVGNGNIDFKKVFGMILPKFNGKIILEITQSNNDLIQSKNIISSIINEEKAHNN